MYSSTTLLSSTGIGVEVAGEGVGTDAQGFQRDRAAAGERVDDQRPGARRAAERLVGGLGERAAGFEVLRDGGVVPVGEVGDEVEQGEPELVEMDRVGRVEPSPSLPGLTIPSHWPNDATEAVSCRAVLP